MKKIFVLTMALLIPLTETLAFAQCGSGGGSGLFSRLRERRAARTANAQFSSVSMSRSYGATTFGSGCSGGFAASTFGSGCSGGSAQSGSIGTTVTTMTPVTVECPTCPNGFATVLRPVTTFVPAANVTVPQVSIPSSAVKQLTSAMPDTPIGRTVCDPATGKCYIISKVESDAADELVVVMSDATQELVASINNHDRDPLQELMAAMDATNELIASPPILLAQR